MLEPAFVPQRDSPISTWLATRRFRADHFPDDLLQQHKLGTSVAVVVPAKECAGTIAAIVRRTIGPFLELGLVDEFIVIDANSRDGTADLAESAGARVIQENTVLPSFGEAQGKGDAMWRAVHATSADIVCFLDGDTIDPDPAHLRGLLGPLLTVPCVELVKGTFQRPLRVGSPSLPDEGGRVTELTARPWLNLNEPRLAGFLQPLAGELAARRRLLETIPFPVGDGVDVAILIDALRLCGLDALAECDLGPRQNRHHALRELGPTAYAVLAAMENRSQRSELRVVDGRFMQPWNDGVRLPVPVGERPALRSLTADDSWAGEVRG